MVSPDMGAAMIGTMYFLRANCAQHGGSASGGGLISASLLKLQGSTLTQVSTLCLAHPCLATKGTPAEYIPTSQNNSSKNAHKTTK